MTPNLKINILDYFYITRPILYIPGWNTLLAGYLVSGNEQDLLSRITGSGYHWHLWVPEVGLMMFIFMLAMGGSFILNQLRDVESDQHNLKLFLVGKSLLSRKTAMREATALIILSLGLSIFVGPFASLLITVFILITGYLYNFAPFQFKNRPIWGLLMNLFMGWLAFAMGWTLSAPLNLIFLLHSLPYIFLNTALYLLTTIPDQIGDRASGKRTFCVEYGREKSIIFSAILYGMSLVLGMVLDDQIILLIDILVLFWFIRMIRILSESAAVKTVKMAIFFFSMVICLKFPAYFFLMLGLFLLTKFYYRRRFDYTYPHFGGE